MKRLLALLAGSYILLLMATQWMGVTLSLEMNGVDVAYPLPALLMLNPLHVPGELAFTLPGFQIWQLLTWPFVLTPQPVIWVILSLVFVGFLGSLESFYGPRVFWSQIVGCLLGAAIVGLPFTLFGFFGEPLWGVSPFFSGLFFVYGVNNRGQTVNLMGLLPIPAGAIALLIVVLIALQFLAREMVNPFYHLGAIAGAMVAYRRGPQALMPEVLREWWIRRRVRKALAKFTVVQGGVDQEETVH